MKYDDRLATILGLTPSAPYDCAVRWRQLVDLVARAGDDGSGPIFDQAIAEIRAGQGAIALDARAAAARAIAGRALPAALLEAFAADRLDVAAPLLVAAPPSAALRAAASPEVRRFLDAMHPPGPESALPEAPPAAPSIIDPVERVEPPRSERETAVSTPTPPRHDPVPPTGAGLALFRWECGPGGNIGWVEGAPRGPLVGRSIARGEEGEGVDREVERAFARRSPFRDATLSLPPGGPIAGDWLISGVPAFAPSDGRFVGYRGIARRAAALAAPAVAAASGPLDPAALRELVHEIKTPLNAIIGFAEIIDGQYLGPAQSGYRERAAEIVAQARILLGAIDDLDFAAQLRGRHGADSVASDFTAIFAGFARRVQAQATEGGVILMADAPPADAPCSLHPELADRLLDRFASAILSAATPGESLRLAAGREDGFCTLRLSRPRALDGLSDASLFDREHYPQADFSLRMVLGLAQLVGGKLTAEGSDLVLRMPMAL